MDPNPNSFPILSYVMAKLPSFGPRRSTDSSENDVEQPPLHSPSKEPYFELKERMPHLTDPKLIADMRSAVADVSQTRSILRNLGDRPDHEAVDTARSKLAEMELKMSEELDEISLSNSKNKVVNEDDEKRKAVDRQKKDMYKAVINLDEMHESYGRLLKEAEERLQKIYDLAVAGKGKGTSDVGVVEEDKEEEEEVNENVVRILEEASRNIAVERADLSQQRLRFLPEAFGKIKSLLTLNLSSNQLQVVPDSIAGLENLEELYLSANLLETLPESIGLLLNLKVLDVSTNKLTALPDSICHCRSLVELDASFNKLTYLPTNIGYELVNLRRLSIQLNKIRSLPTSIGEMSSLCFLDVHFNELRGLPPSIGKLTNLEVLNLSSNFSDMTELPDTVGDLSNLKELDLSNNQIHSLPTTFGRLDNLVKLNLDENPLLIPPKEIVDAGVEVVKAFMSRMWLNSLVEEEEHTPLGWLSRSTSWLKESVESVSGYLGVNEKTEDPCLNQQL